MTYFAVVVQIIFPENEKGRKSFVFKSVNTFKIYSSWKTLTDTAEVSFSKKYFFNQKALVDVNVGDPIIIKGGYNGEYYEEFSGVVSQIKDDFPVILKCEDNMFFLKRTRVHKSFPKMKLGDFLKAIVPTRFIINAMDMDIPENIWANTTVSQVLTKLKDNYNIYSYFVGNTLVSGKIYSDNPNRELVKYSLFGTNCNVIKNDLNYLRKEDISLRIIMKSLGESGTIKSVEIGDKEGQTQTFFTSTTDTEKMKIEGKKIYDNLKIDGYTGTLTTFARPFVKHGYTATIINKQDIKKEGDYYIDAVTTHLNDSGAYRREITLGKKAAKQN